MKIFILFAGFWCMTASAARVLFFSAESSNPTVEERLKLACRFYGIDFENGPDAEESETPTAVVVDATALRSLTPADLPVGNRGLLIAGINSRTSADSLRSWAGEPVAPADRVIKHAMDSFVTVSEDSSGLTLELTGQKLPVDIAEGVQLTTVAARPILSYPDGNPLFAAAGNPAQPIYLLADLSVIDPPGSSIRFYDCGFFVEIAPYMIFLRKTFGESVWHADGDYANLTIDDPWLCDSYGNLNFMELLHEMDRADFHTTIAYIPWNYDRVSSGEVVQIFKDRPDRFSLCVHGNNHDHREFYSYEEKPGSEWPSRPLKEQEADIRQGLARIKTFEQLNGLSVDRVMVFPHGIAPDETLGLLKKYNFRATSNAGYVPLDTPMPNDPLFWLRRMTDRFGGGVPSLDRAEPANLTPADVAIDLFLDSPVLFVEHLRFFSDSRAAFNSFAEQVNTVQPAVRWVGLGKLAQHLYLQRREDDGTWTVRAFSPEIVLSNPDQEPRQVRVLKADDGRIPVQQVFLDDQPVEFFQGLEKQIQINLTLAPQEQKRLRILYENDFSAENISLAKPDFRVNLLRHLSDIRDQHLTAGPLGAFIDRFYYDSSLYQFGVKALMAAAAGVVLIPLILFFLIRKKAKKRYG